MLMFILMLMKSDGLKGKCGIMWCCANIIVYKIVY